MHPSWSTFCNEDHGASVSYYQHPHFRYGQEIKPWTLEVVVLCGSTPTSDKAEDLSQYYPGGRKMGRKTPTLTFERRWPIVPPPPPPSIQLAICLTGHVFTKQIKLSEKLAQVLQKNGLANL